MVGGNHIPYKYCSHGMKGELHEAMGLAIPALVKLLRHKNEDTRSATVSVLGNLSAHSERQSCSI